MPSAGRLVDETLSLLQSAGQDSEQVTTLAGDILSTDTTLAVTTVRSGAMGISPGLIEIDSELLYVSSVDATGNAVVEPWGRGYDGSVAADHAAGSRVVSQPTYPRSKVLEALNEAILRTYSAGIFVAKVANFTTTNPRVTYDLPDSAVWVIDARWQPPTGTGYWQAVQRYRMSTGGTSVADDPGVSVDVSDYMLPGCPIEFTYAAKPGTLTAESDDFEATTGLPLSMKDVIVTGAACGNLVPSQELSRLQTSSIEQQNRAALVAPSAALTSSRYLEAKFQQRLGEEMRALRRKYPIRIARSWV